MIAISPLNDFTDTPMLTSLFNILATNMSAIAPSGNSYEEDYKTWLQYRAKDLAMPNRSMLLIYLDHELVGYFMYSIADEIVFRMEDFQIIEKYRTKHGIFRAMYGDVINRLEGLNITTVEAHSNLKNDKSIAVLKALGLKIVNETPNHYQLRGDYADLLKWYNGKSTCK